MVPWLGLSRFTSTPRRQTINPIYTLHSGGHPDQGIAFRSRLCAKLARKQPSFGEGSSPEDHLARLRSSEARAPLSLGSSLV